MFWSLAYNLIMHHASHRRTCGTKGLYLENHNRSFLPNVITMPYCLLIAWAQSFNILDAQIFVFQSFCIFVWMICSTEKWDVIRAPLSHPLLTWKASQTWKCFSGRDLYTWSEVSRVEAKSHSARLCWDENPLLTIIKPIKTRVSKQLGSTKWFFTFGLLILGNIRLY